MKENVTNLIIRVGFEEKDITNLEKRINVLPLLLRESGFTPFYIKLLLPTKALQVLSDLSQSISFGPKDYADYRLQKYRR